MDFWARYEMIKASYPTISVLSIEDCESDAKWSERLDKSIDTFSGKKRVDLLAGRDNFFSHYSGRHRKVQIAIRTSDSSTEIRRSIFQAGALPSQDFRSGVIYSSLSGYPRVFPTVDIAVTDDDGRVLLGQRHAKDKLRFPGGFVDPTDFNLEVAAKRELMEECDLGVEGDLTYLGSFRVEDWRYKGTPDAIVTTLFHAKRTFGCHKAKDDMASIGWYDPLEVKTAKMICASHQPLYARFVEWVVNGGLLI